MWKVMLSFQPDLFSVNGIFIFIIFLTVVCLRSPGSCWLGNVHLKVSDRWRWAKNRRGCIIIVPCFLEGDQSNFLMWSAIVAYCLLACGYPHTFHYRLRSRSLKRMSVPLCQRYATPSKLNLCRYESPLWYVALVSMVHRIWVCATWPWFPRKDQTDRTLLAVLANVIYNVMYSRTACVIDLSPWFIWYVTCSAVGHREQRTGIRQSKHWLLSTTSSQTLTNASCKFYDPENLSAT